MPDSLRREKMISLRLSAVEYEVLKKHHDDFGARNVSELARLALQRIVSGSAAPQDAFATKLVELDNRVRTLESQLRTTHALLDPCASVVESEAL